MIRNLLSNALKYSETGKILLGCRRRGAVLSVEVWDTGIGIPADELKTIFVEYHQVGNDARARGRGLGLGLSIVQRLSVLLGHRVRVESREGQGSMFAVEVPLATRSTGHTPAVLTDAKAAALAEHPRSTILIIEDDPDLRDLIGLLLESEGYQVLAARDGPAALKLLQDGSAPHLLLADFNLPGGLNGLQTVSRIRQNTGQAVPAIILTGDISTDTMRKVAAEGCTQLNKPAKHEDLIRAVAAMLAHGSARPAVTAQLHSPVADRSSTVFVVDDDADVRAALGSVLEDDGRAVAAFADGEAFLASPLRHGPGCLLIDAYLPGMNGLDLLRQLRDAGSRLPAIMITGRSDVAMAVQAMKVGASDFIEKPVGRDDLLASIDRALDQARDKGKQVVWREDAARNVGALTPRQRQVLARVVAGQASKNIAADLDISQRTVENHRASIMRKTGATSLPALARLALAATWDATADVPEEAQAS